MMPGAKMQNRVATEFERLLGVALETTAYTGKTAFSYMLVSLYDFFLCKANDKSFLLMCLKENSEYTPGRVAKYMAQAQAISGLPAVFAADSMVAYKRQRFLAKHIPFIIPGKQAYIPFIGIFLTEGGPQVEKHFDELGNLAQILVLARLMRKFAAPLSIAEAGRMFSYSRISVIRAFDELEYFQLGQRNPRSKYLEFPLIGKALWKKALPILKNPCRKRIGVEHLPAGLPSFSCGINALSERSMLSAEEQLQLAVEAKKLNKLKLTDRCPEEDAPVLLELWKYPPNIIGGDSVDPLSLYLTLRDAPDERVQIALEEMMKGLLS